jgi:hypothetical protein
MMIIGGEVVPFGRPSLLEELEEHEELTAHQVTGISGASNGTGFP